MKQLFITLFLLSINTNLIAANNNFTLCKSTFALCTTALCKPIHGKKGFVSCNCSVKINQYSVGTKSCTGVTKTKQGIAISSRYSPIKSYVSCNNSRSWAFCLDSPCIIDAKNPKKAACLCSLIKNQGNYIIVTDHYNKTTCTKGIYSSATINDVTQITDFLNGRTELPAYPIKVLNAPIYKK